MKQGHLAEYFTGIGMKRLSAVETDAARSHQHEFNGSKDLKRIFGDAPEKLIFPARFVYLNDDDDEAVVADATVTWYDSRARHATRSEHRLYFPGTSVTDCAAAGDILVIGRRSDASVLVVIAEGGSTIASQIRWLFGVSDLAHPGFSIREELTTEQDRVAFATATILENIGVIVEPPPDTHLDEMLRRFNGVFPTTRIFSAYARFTVPEIPADGDPDAVVMAWMEREEILFRTLERHLISGRLTQGFGGDVDGFISFSLSVQNRRKSRAGAALENHLEEIFRAAEIRYSRTPKTENKSKPDFIFPGATEYQDSTFDPRRLAMLGVKTSAKDRWRQVLAEADRIGRKHLMTIEAAISTAQTDEMQAKLLQLVLPRSLHASYTPAQQTWVMDLSAFISDIRARQAF